MMELRCMNDDILMQVLSKLSTKDVHMLKCVAKEWHNLILDRSFICLQLKKTEAVSGFFFQARFQWCDEDINNISYIPLETRKTQVHSTVLNFLPEEVGILASCNGLLCCRSSYPRYPPLIYVCNPLNKQWMSVNSVHYSTSASAALVFDPFKLHKDDASPNFKIVTVSETESEDEQSKFAFQIYSSETGKWRQSREMCHCNQKLFKMNGIFADGSLYWLMDGDKILMFNPETELSWLLNVPLPITEFRSIPEICIGESKGKLHCVLLSEYGLQLWALEDFFTSQWNLTCSVSLDKLEEENSQFLYQIAEKLATRDTFCWIKVFAFKDGILFLSVSSHFYSYDFATRKMKKLCAISDLGPNSREFPMVVPYTMSLVPLGPV
ncbi:F-box protein At5g49610-like [Coffea arabica]|uniref:F-box protein At1g20360-like n=1 Tax=Coffea arabica TaxID=13443 RepID=A0A6P6XEF8_COFAR|nr:F-box protein At1g20360-like [Coffea arabica]